MPQIQYPFIDIAVHPSVRARFAAGEAIVLFSKDLGQVLWANGEGARLFGFGDIYDLFDNGPDRTSVSFRQLAATARQLSEVGQKRSLVMRVNSGFSSRVLNADVTLAEIRRGEQCLMFASEGAAKQPFDARIQSMLKGFDDPDTHMAIFDNDGQVLASSKAFSTLGISMDTARGLIQAALRSPDGLVKRPVASAAGYLPAAIGTISGDPALHLLFCVETVLGRMDAPEEHTAEMPEPVAADDPEDGAPPEPNMELLADIAASIEPIASEEEPEEFTALVGAYFETDDVIHEQDVVLMPEEVPLSQSAEVARTEPSLETIAEQAEAKGQEENAVSVPEEVEPVVSEEALAETSVPNAGEEVSEEAEVEEVEEVEEPAAHAAKADNEQFVFQRASRPVRFVWKLDAYGRFTEVSDEFAATVGPNAGAISGMAFRELSNLFGLDPGNEINRLLDRRDTWSGRTIRWPVEGTDLLVPVDLAALPTYSRNREFDGFRGFGIIRVGDAEKDPHALGMTFNAPLETSANDNVGVAEDTAHIEPSIEPEPQLPEETSPTEDAQEVSDLREPLGQEDDKSELDFQGEVPALKFSDDPAPTLSDKIIQLEERRARVREGLTQNEQAAFKEIARQLEPFGKRPNEKIEQNDNIEPEKTEDQVPPIESEALVSASDAALSEPVRSFDNDRPVFRALSDDPEDNDAYLGLTAEAANQIPLAMLIHAGDRLVHANTEFLKFTGYESIEELEVAGGLECLISSGEGGEGNVQMIARDGRHVPVTARLQSIRFEGAKLLMLALSPVQVLESSLEEDEETAHRMAALTVEADELRSILETATDGVIVLDIDGRIRSMNRSASALFNFDDNETRGKPFAMLFAHESQRAVQDYLSSLAGHGVASVLNDGREVIGREASGGFIPLFMTMGRMPGSNSYCAVIRDITQWKRSEDELRSAKRAAETANQHKSDFLARVSHEIRTPLNAIIGFSDMIGSEHFGPAGHPRYVEYANDIGRSGRHVLEIVNDLLDISKIEAGEMDLDFTAVGINDCLSEAVSLVQPQANQQRVIIRTSLSQSVPNVVADLRSVKQIAINILANAIRFTPSGGQIVVSTAYEANGSVTLRIRDTGVGMTKAELEQAMRAFGQVSPGARRRGDGTGLGLPLTKAMTEANRAMFSIQSAPNEGTLVEITFPPQRVLAD